MTTLEFCYAIVFFAEALIGWQYLSGVFQVKLRAWVLSIVYFIGYGIAYCFFSVATVWVNILTFLLLHVLLIVFGYSTGLKCAFFHACLLTALMFVSEIAAAVPLGMIFEHFDRYQTDVTILLLLTVLSKILYFVLTRVCLHIRRGKEARTMDGSEQLLLSSFSLASIIVLIALGYIALSAIYDQIVSWLIMGAAFVLLFADVLLFIVHQRYQRLRQENLFLQLIQQKESADQHYFRTLEEHYTGQLILIHDFRNHLSVIREIAQEMHDSKVIEYVSELEGLPALQKGIRYCNNSVLNAVISYFAELCQRKNIQFSVRVHDKSLEKLAMSDITALVGNLLENAVEAAECSEDPYIELIIERKVPQNKVFFSLINTCFDIPIQNHLGEYITQKQEKEVHGIGLRSVRRTVKKYGGNIKQYFDQNTKTFHTMVLLPCVCGGDKETEVDFGN